MDRKHKLMKLALTAAALSLAATPLMSTTAYALVNKVNCYGVNSCKGQSACKTAKNACKGQNACKGLGVVMMTEKKCEKLGGSTKEPT